MFGDIAGVAAIMFVSLFVGTCPVWIRKLQERFDI